ncbi:hypothetical protein BH11PLA1_BH11PLA1_08110 [soil metagenome]
MTPTSFFEHWGILENPFRAEEARQDAVLARLIAPQARPSAGGTFAAPPGLAPAAGGANAAALHPVSTSLSARAQHGDAEKVIGDLERPTSAVVFGEKGSGKTALRVQIHRAAALHNAAHPRARVLLIAHDDLTAFLERLHARNVRQTRKGQSTPGDSFKLTRMVDHADGIVAAVVPALIEQLIANAPTPNPAAGDPAVLDLGPEPRRIAREMDRQGKRDLMVLQAIYDRGDGVGERAHLLRRAIGVRRPISEYVEWIVTRFGWLAPVIAILWVYQIRRPDFSTGFLGLREWATATQRDLSAGTPDGTTISWGTFILTSFAIWALFVAKRSWTHRILFNRVTRRVFKQVRVTGRSERSFAASLHELPAGWRGGGVMPVNDAEATRLAMLQRLRAVLKPFGYQTLLVVIDRVDEPALIAGDVERMRAVIWPILSNSYLQQEGVATKLLLPIELRHALLRESAAFFQQARMDKQSLVEQLGWTGPMLYDLCDARLAACRAAAAAPVVLSELFDAQTPREALIEALEQMRQPRDALKFLYACISEHCARTVEPTPEHAAGSGGQETGVAGDSTSTPRDPNAGYRVARTTFDEVRKAQVERMRQLAMGVRPA